MGDAITCHPYWAYGTIQLVAPFISPSDRVLFRPLQLRFLVPSFSLSLSLSPYSSVYSSSPPLPPSTSPLPSPSIPLPPAGLRLSGVSMSLR